MVDLVAVYCILHVICICNTFHIWSTNICNFGTVYAMYQHVHYAYIQMNN